MTIIGSYLYSVIQDLFWLSAKVNKKHRFFTPSPPEITALGKGQEKADNKYFPRWPPPAARYGNLMLMKRYGWLKIDCCIPVLADRNIKKQGDGVSVIRTEIRRWLRILTYRHTIKFCFMTRLSDLTFSLNREHRHNFTVTETGCEKFVPELIFHGQNCQL